MMISNRITYAAIVMLLGLSACVVDRGEGQGYSQDRYRDHDMSQRDRASDRDDQRCEGHGRDGSDDRNNANCRNIRH